MVQNDVPVRSSENRTLHIVPPGRRLQEAHRGGRRRGFAATTSALGGFSLLADVAEMDK